MIIHFTLLHICRHPLSYTFNSTNILFIYIFFLQIKLTETTMEREREMEIPFHVEERIIPIRQMPIYTQRVHYPFYVETPRVHVDPRLHHTAMPHLMFTASLERHHRVPSFSGPIGGPGRIHAHHHMQPMRYYPKETRRSNSLNYRPPPKQEDPIVDFPEVDDSSNTGVEEEEDSTSIEEELARIQPVSETSEDTFDQFKHETTDSGDGSQQEEANDGYVCLETIRRVKEEARQQAVRMREREARENVETIDLRNSSAQSHYDRPRSNAPSTGVRNNGRQRWTGGHPTGRGREWIPGGSNIPDGIVAGSHSNVAGRRLVSIPDSVFYATISETGTSTPGLDNSVNSSPQNPHRGKEGALLMTVQTIHITISHGEV